MACLLFKSYLILASVSKHDHYKVKFAVTLAIARIEEPGHGKGECFTILEELISADHVN